MLVHGVAGLADIFLWQAGVPAPLDIWAKAINFVCGVMSCSSAYKSTIYSSLVLTLSAEPLVAEGQASAHSYSTFLCRAL